MYVCMHPCVRAHAPAGYTLTLVLPQGGIVQECSILRMAGRDTVGNLAGGGVSYVVVARGERRGTVPKDGAYHVQHATPGIRHPSSGLLSTPWKEARRAYG